MKLRSLLFVPADDERKMRNALASHADVVILDLEDSVAPHRKAEARATASDFLANSVAGAANIFVRVNALATGMTGADLDAVVGPGLAGIMLPKAEGAADLAALARELESREAARGLVLASVKIIVVATETPRAIFNLGSYPVGDDRLVAMTWGAEDLAAAVGATANKEPDGLWTQPYQQVRALCLIAAAAAEVPAIDTLYSDFRDVHGLAASCGVARRDGFSGRIAIHPAQVDVINHTFSPSTEEIAAARRIVDAFAANPDAGTLGIDGRMVDIPHLKAAQKTLAACPN